MAKPSKQASKRTDPPGDAPENGVGKGGETHQVASGELLTTNQGVPVSDNQSSLRAGPRGPTLLEDFVLREKIMHFDHERIPERIVHARGYGAHGFFEVTDSLTQFTRADFLQRVGDRTEAFVRFSTVAGGSGSVDLPRDVRGFAVKLYTREGNFDLVGNDIPVFFIQDAIKFPDLIHAVKMEPDRGYPQAASAHDTFWDFMSLTPESTHMIMWAMSDRGIPRSVRMIEGFGIHTFRLVNAKGASTFVKFHWRPKLGLASVLWDEAVKISGADNDFHRRDLWEAIDSGAFPEWDLCVQLFTETDASDWDFDVLDPTKLVPEELVPLRKVGRLVLDRNPTNFFAETEQVAFCPANIVPGIDFSDDPLLQGRLFSYLDTQLSRLGSPNHHQIPINAPRCPMHNMQRDGHMQTKLHAGRVSYEPNTLAPDGPRESPTAGFRTFVRPTDGGTHRVRSESFADHYSQARLFWKSQSASEQSHIVQALVFELGKVETPPIRSRVVGHLVHVDPKLAARVASGLGMEHVPPAAETTVLPHDMPISPALSIHAKARQTLEGRVVGCVVSDGADGTLVDALREAVEGAKARLVVIAPKIGGVRLAKERGLPADAALRGAPSVLFDAVALVLSDQGAAALAKDAGALGFVRDAFAHLKVIGYATAAKPLLVAAGLDLSIEDAGILAIDHRESTVDHFIRAAEQQRVWHREARVHELL